MSESNVAVNHHVDAKCVAPDSPIISAKENSYCRNGNTVVSTPSPILVKSTHGHSNKINRFDNNDNSGNQNSRSSSSSNSCASNRSTIQQEPKQEPSSWFSCGRRQRLSIAPQPSSMGAERGRRAHGKVSVSKCSEFLRLAKPVLIPIATIFIFAILTIIFEYIPNSYQRFPPSLGPLKNKVSQIVSPSLSPLKNKVSQIVSKTLEVEVPAWLPIWSVRIPSGTIDRRLPSIAELDQDARNVLSVVHKVKEQKFFRIFKVDLNKPCPFWAVEQMCTSAANLCSVCECNDTEIPHPWKMKPIEDFIDRNHYEDDNVHPWGLPEDDVRSTTEKNAAVFGDRSPLLVDQTFNAGPEKGGPSRNVLLMASSVSDEKIPTASYVDLTLNRAGYTAFKGRHIWRLVHNENCMTPVVNELTNITELAAPQKCQEDVVFYKMVSGIQTVISALASEYYRPKDPEEQDRTLRHLKASHKVLGDALFSSQHTYSLQFFKQTIAGHPDYMANLYFSFGVLLRALCQVKPVLETCSCDTGTPFEDAEARAGLQTLLGQTYTTCDSKYLKEGPFFERRHEVALRQFQNISRILDCLECEKCRLHGKLKTLGLYVALKAAGKGTPIRRLERNEVIALINTLDNFADSIVILSKFQQRLVYMRVAWGAGIIASCACFGVLIRAFRSKSSSAKKRRYSMSSGSEDSSALYDAERVGSAASPFRHETAAQRRRNVSGRRGG